MDRARRHPLSFCDAQASRWSEFSIRIEQGRLELAAASAGHGLAVRVLIDGAWGLGCTHWLSKRAAERCLQQALSCARQAGARADHALVWPSLQPVRADHAVPARRPTYRVPINAKIKKLMELHDAAKAAVGGHTNNVVVTYHDQRWEACLVNAVGSEVHTAGSSVLTTVTVTVEAAGHRQQGFNQAGGQGGVELLFDLDPQRFASDLANLALRKCRARAAPPGEWPVIMAPSFAGLFAHEVIGHGAEADAYHAGESILSGRLGDTLADSPVSMVDDPTCAAGFGHYAFDDEGQPAGRVLLLDHGRFLGLLHSLTTAAQMAAAPTGHARTGALGMRAIPRMSNTYFLPGSADLKQMLRGIDRGLYLADGWEGEVLLDRGIFQGRAANARLIEHGQLGETLRDTTVSGEVFQTLRRIDLVGDDLQLASPGYCSKSGQEVCTDGGGPHLRVQGLLVAGEDQP